MKLKKPWLILAHAAAVGTTLVGCGGDGSTASYEADGPDGIQTPTQGVVSGPEHEQVKLGYENAPSSPESGVQGNVDVIDDDGETDQNGDGDQGGDGDIPDDVCEELTEPCAKCACENYGGDLTVCVAVCSS